MSYDIVKLKESIFDWYSEKHPEIGVQIKIADNNHRHTGLGFFVDFNFYKEVDPLPDYFLEANKIPLLGPFIELDKLDCGAQSILLIENRMISILEVFTYAENFPKQFSNFILKEKSNFIVSKAIKKSGIYSKKNKRDNDKFKRKLINT